METAAIMIADPIRVTAEDSLEMAVRLMDDHDVRHLPVMEFGRLVGLISPRQRRRGAPRAQSGFAYIESKV